MRGGRRGREDIYVCVCVCNYNRFTLLYHRKQEISKAIFHQLKINEIKKIKTLSPNIVTL